MGGHTAFLEEAIVKTARSKPIISI